jgi:hypothetical protein
MPGVLLYRGPSMLDGAPIVVIATWREQREIHKVNVKTGPVIQTWIMREDLGPVAAAKSGADESVCGGCRLRGDYATGGSRACYVTLFQAPRSVHDAYVRGIYPVAETAEDIAAVGAGEVVRLGSYGDPAAVPTEVLAALVSRAAAWTGYTHQWRDSRIDPALKEFAMASCDRPADRAEAKASGWRTFRVRAEEQEVQQGEISCPASKEAGHRTTCRDCKLCGGLSSKSPKDITIIAHGAAPVAQRAAALARS